MPAGPTPSERSDGLPHRRIDQARHETESNHLRVHFANIRRKLEPDPSRPRYFITEPGMGYRLAA